MKTTFDITDSLMDEAKACARRRGVPLRQIVEEGLRVVVTNSPEQKPLFKLRDGSFKGEGLVSDLSWSEIRDVIYQGRGT